MVFLKIESYTSLVCLKALGQSYYNKEPRKTIRTDSKISKVRE